MRLGGDAGEIQVTHTKRTNRTEPLQCTEQAYGRSMCGRSTEQFPRGSRAHPRRCQQVFEAAPLRCFRQGCELPPEAFSNPVPHAGDQDAPAWSRLEEGSCVRSGGRW